MKTNRTFKASCLLYKAKHKENKKTLDGPKKMHFANKNSQQLDREI